MKRFTETSKWGDAWFSSLRPEAKLAWVYLIDNCDIDGWWEANLPKAYREIGFPGHSSREFWDGIFDELNQESRHVARVTGGKWWLTTFIKFQYGQLKPWVPLHRSVLRVLERHGLKEEYASIVPGGISSNPQHKEIKLPAHRKRTIFELKEMIKAAEAQMEDLTAQVRKHASKEFATQALAEWAELDRKVKRWQKEMTNDEPNKPETESQES